MSYKTQDSVKVVLNDVSLTFKRGRNIGILGVNGAGKSTLIRLLSGTEMPVRGRIFRNARVSFPIGFSAAIHPNLSGRENVVFMSRVYGVSAKEVIEYVQIFADIGDYFDMPTRTYSSGMIARLCFGLSLAIDFDVYLIDEVTAVGDARFQARCRAAFEERARHSNLIMVSHSFDTIRSYCDTAALLHGGELVFFDKLEDAIDAYRSILGVDRRD
jgi:capsular polysaccharide transport system ATP-binding protein